MDLHQDLSTVLQHQTKLPLEDIQLLLTTTPDAKMGDYAFPCFKLTTIQNKNPKDAATTLQTQLQKHLPEYISHTQINGPYLNFYLNYNIVAKNILTKIQTENKTYGSAKNKKNIVIEYCGPNTNKPLHLGHMRNMALGNAICRLSTFCGNTVHPVNIINDRGIHICQSMLAYQKWGKNKKPDKKGDHFVGDYYVLFAKALQEHPELKDEAQQLLQAWEDKDKDTHKLWKEMTNWVLRGFAETYKRFGITFEKEYFESNHYEQGRDLALEGLKKGIFIKNDDKSILAKLESYGIPDKIVLRADGTSIYITQDLYLAQQRHTDYKFDQMIYVVASEQQLHFKQLFKILELLQKPFAKSLHHLSYGLVNLPSGRMKSREGTVVDADDLMDEIAMLARSEVTLRYPNMDEKEKQQRAEFIALGAIKFFLLRTDPIRDMVFNPEESISFEGETGPYIQYTHARACAILRKAHQPITELKTKTTTKNIKYERLTETIEKKIIKYLLQFPSAIEESATHLKPHLLCRLLLDLAQSFNEYYHAHPVINEDLELMNARLALVDSVRQVLENGLNLLGIKAPEEM